MKSEDRRLVRDMIKLLKELRMELFAAGGPAASRTQEYYGALSWSAVEDPSRIESTLVKILYQITDLSLRNPKNRNIHNCHRFFQPMAGGTDANAPDLSSMPAFRYFYAMLQALIEIVTLASAGQDVLALDDERLAAFAENLRRRGAAHHADGDSPERLAYDLAIGQVYSLIDRGRAATFFRQVRNSKYAGLIGKFYRDNGAYTYFSTDELLRDNEDTACVIEQNFKHEITYSTTNEYALVCSADEAFFRIYGPLLLFFASKLPDIDFVIVLCGDRQSRDLVREDATAYVASLARFSGLPAASNIKIVEADTPIFVKDIKTWYACARFFAIRPLLEKYFSLYLIDIDNWPVSDPRPHLAAVRALPFALPHNNSLTSLSPWRRDICNSVAVNRLVLPTSFMPDLLGYLVHGLSCPKSWMLDQNAITYALERQEPPFPSLNSERPIIPISWRAVWETLYSRKRGA